MYRTCGDSKCEPNYGKKRPEHSKKMKELAVNGSSKYKNTLMKKGERFNKEVNSTSFKRKRLIKHGYDVADKTDEQIAELYSVLLSNFNKSLYTRKRSIVSNYVSWEQEYKDLILVVTKGIVPTEAWINTLSEDNINELWSRIHGINTIRNWNKVKKTRSNFFKQSHLTGFKHNKKQESIFVKSGLEKEYVEFFETEGFEWEYETIIIETLKKDGFYVPDFLVKIENRTIILEAKGSFYRSNIQDYIENKVKAAQEYCKEHGYEYVLTQKRPDKQLNFIKYALIKD